jgi:hypothetical protein
MLMKPSRYAATEWFGSSFDGVLWSGTPGLSTEKDKMNVLSAGLIT